MTSDESSEDEDENPFVKKKDPEARKLERVDRAKRYKSLKLQYMILYSAGIWAYLNFGPNPFNRGMGWFLKRPQE